MTKAGRGPYQRGIRKNPIQEHPLLQGHVRLSACMVRIPGQNFERKKGRFIYVRQFDDTSGYVVLQDGTIYRIKLDQASNIWDTEGDPVAGGGSEEAICG